MHPQNKNIFFAFIYFLLATILSGIFINNFQYVYSGASAMLLSGLIAGTKWLLQIFAALLFLKEKKWIFIRRIGFICFVGSAILWVYYLFNIAGFPLAGISPFILSIGLCVLVMIVMYFLAVKKTGISIAWFWGWMLCLATAILLQVFVVFNN